MNWSEPPGWGRVQSPMKTNSTIPAILAVAVTFMVAGLVPAHADSRDDKRRQDIREMRDKVLADLYKERPETRKKIREAEGYAVFSNIGVNVIFASVGGGRGVVVDKRGQETFMRMGTAGLGIGLGVKDFRGVFIFWDKDKLNTFLEHGWDFSGQADAAAKSTEMGGEVSMAATVLPGVELYQFTEAGLALQATLQGTKYWRDKRLN